MIRVIIADDHGVLRDGLAELCSAQPDIDVVATARDADEAVAACRDTAPSVAVIDLSMPGGGIEALRSIAATCPSTRTLVLTMHDDAESLRACLAAGAAGYLVKQAAAGQIVDAIREVHAGKQSIRIELPVDALARVHGAAAAASNAPPPDALSLREREVLELIAYGYTSREVAAALQLSPKSIDSYRERLYEKLGMRGRAELVRYALDHGILSADGPTSSVDPSRGP